MDLKLEYKVVAVVLVVLALVMFVVPERVVGFFGANVDWPVTDGVRTLSGVLLGLAMLEWMASEPAGDLKTSTLYASFLGTLVAFGVGLSAMLSQRYNTWGWVGVVVVGLFALGYLLYGLLKQERA